MLLSLELHRATGAGIDSVGTIPCSNITSLTGGGELLDLSMRAAHTDR